jgi:hypothetical protein
MLARVAERAFAERVESLMAPGDAQRVWFPEMLEVLTATWSTSTTWDELIELCGRVTVLRTELRQSLGIQAPLMKCPKCGSISRSDIKGVSIRSALFALRKIGAISDSDFQRLDRDWKKHRAARGLDALAKASDTSSSATTHDSSGCC